MGEQRDTEERAHQDMTTQTGGHLLQLHIKSDRLLHVVRIVQVDDACLRLGVLAQPLLALQDDVVGVGQEEGGSPVGDAVSSTTSMAGFGRARRSRS